MKGIKLLKLTEKRKQDNMTAVKERDSPCNSFEEYEKSKNLGKRRNRSKMSECQESEKIMKECSDTAHTPPKKATSKHNNDYSFDQNND